MMSDESQQQLRPGQFDSDRLIDESKAPGPLNDLRQKMTPLIVDHGGSMTITLTNKDQMVALGMCLSCGVSEMYGADNVKAAISHGAAVLIGDILVDALLPEEKPQDATTH